MARGGRFDRLQNIVCARVHSLPAGNHDVGAEFFEKLNNARARGNRHKAVFFFRLDTL